ncbi:MAG: PAS domain-containing protein, partial [Deltaproteobacteria bacterium]|nr:PAS domain-containing protein [Deltaproteobacteria bacterium]
MLERISSVVESEFVFETGEKGWYELRLSPIPAGILVISRDITERKQAEEALRESEEMWRTLTENSPNHIMLLDLDHTIRFINYTVPDLTREQVIGKSSFDFIPADSRQVMVECYERVIRSGKTNQYETKYITAEGETHYFEARISPLLDKDGQVSGFINTSSDITERKRADEALRTAKETQDAILATTDVLLAYLDREFNFITVNQTYADAGRRRREDFVGRNHFELYPHQENQALFESVVETGEALYITAKPFEHPDQPERGTTYWNWSLIPRKDEAGRVQSLVFSVLDVTELIRVEESLREKTHQLGERVKELNCLYGLAQLVETADVSVSGILQGIVELIPPAFQYPDITCARIVCDGQEYKTENFRATPWQQTAAIMVYGQTFGYLEVGYTAEKPPSDEGPFV